MQLRLTCRTLRTHADATAASAWLSSATVPLLAANGLTLAARAPSLSHLTLDLRDADPAGLTLSLLRRLGLSGLRHVSSVALSVPPDAELPPDGIQSLAEAIPPSATCLMLTQPLAPADPALPAAAAAQLLLPSTEPRVSPSPAAARAARRGTGTRQRSLSLWALVEVLQLRPGVRRAQRPPHVLCALCARTAASHTCHLAHRPGSLKSRATATGVDLSFFLFHLAHRPDGTPPLSREPHDPILKPL